MNATLEEGGGRLRAMLVGRELPGGVNLVFQGIMTAVADTSKCSSYSTGVSKYGITVKISSPHACFFCRTVVTTRTRQEKIIIAVSSEDIADGH